MRAPAPPLPRPRIRPRRDAIRGKHVIVVIVVVVAGRLGQPQDARAGAARVGEREAGRARTPEGQLRMLCRAKRMPLMSCEALATSVWEVAVPVDVDLGAGGGEGPKSRSAG